MKLRIHFAYMVLIFAFTVTPFLAAEFGDLAQSKASKVRKKNAEMIVGEIMGAIALKENRQERDGSKTEYIAGYYSANGRDIEMIGESGVLMDEGSSVVLLTASRKDHLPDDSEVFQAAMEEIMSGGRIDFPTFRSLPGGLNLIIAGMKLGKRGLTNVKLLGEVQKEQSKWQITPAIRIKTEKGVVTVSVNDVVEFKEKGEKPDQEKKNQ